MSAETTVTRRHLRTLAGCRRGAGLAAEADVVTEVHAVAGVALPDASRLEPARDVVLGDPDLIVAVGEVRRVDELQLVGEVLAEREPRARIGLVGDQRRLDADLAEAGGFPQAAAERRPDAAGQIRQHLLARDLVFLAAHLVERAAGDEHAP